MKTLNYTLLFILISVKLAIAQDNKLQKNIKTEQLSPRDKIVLKDSITISIYPKYDKVGKVHRIFFGENYRKEYAMPTRVPIIRLSAL